jgi:hypothetical protein
MTKKTIYNILNMARHYIVHYLKDTYILKSKSESGKMEQFSVDESKLLNINNEIIWMNTHINNGNIIITDRWSGYNWISAPSSRYIHHVHNHGHGYFVTGLDRTTNIEQIWSQIKNIIKRKYNVTQKEKYILFLGEAEFIIMTKNMNNEKKFSELLSVFNYIRDLNINELYSFNY